jgi:hypothetical protein
VIERVQSLLNSPTELVAILAALTFFVLVTGLVMMVWRSVVGRRGGRLDVLRRAELKREIVFEMRRRMAPQSAAEMGKHLTLNVFETASLLDALVKEGLLESYTSTDRLMRWRLKGLPTRPTA